MIEKYKKRNGFSFLFLCLFIQIHFMVCFVKQIAERTIFVIHGVAVTIGVTDRIRHIAGMILFDRSM